VAFVQQESFGDDGGIKVACRLLDELQLCPSSERIHPVLGTVHPGGGYWSFWRRPPDRPCAASQMSAEAESWVRSHLDWSLEGAFGYAPPASRNCT
jgi:hypothetical protein